MSLQTLNFVEKWAVDALKPNKMKKFFFLMIIIEICGVSRRETFKVKKSLLELLIEEQHASTLSPLVLSFLRKPSLQLRTLDMILEEWKQSRDFLVTTTLENSTKSVDFVIILSTIWCWFCASSLQLYW